MTSLKLKYDISDFLGRGVPAPPLLALITDRDMNTKEVFLTADKETQPIEVPPGDCYIRVNQPSGKYFALRSSVESGESREVVIKVPAPPQPSRHEWLFYQHALGALPPPHPSETQFLGFDVAVAPAQAVRVRLWQFEKAAWSPQLPPPPQTTPGYAGFEFPPINALRYLQCGFPAAVPSRLVALPGAGKVRAILCWTRSPKEMSTEGLSLGTTGGDLGLVVTTDNAPVEALLRSLAGGSLDMTQHMFGLDPNGPGAQSAFAQDLLRDKMNDPIAAAVGGYALLRCAAFDRIHSWAKNLADWFPWLPDGSVVYAWQLLSDPAKRDYVKARSSLLDAARCGVPVFTEGLRLLRDGLNYFAHIHQWSDKRPFSSNDDGEARQELERIVKYAGAADWSARHTTFFGSDPQTPSLESAMKPPSRSEPGWLDLQIPVSP
jgi:hypothetical protein